MNSRCIRSAARSAAWMLPLAALAALPAACTSGEGNETGGNAASTETAETPLRSIPQGIYALFEGINPQDQRVTANLDNQCQNMPLIMYSDGFGMQRRFTSREDVMRGNGYYSVVGRLNVAAAGDNLLDLTLREGPEGRDSTPETRRYVAHLLPGGAVTLVQEDGNDGRILVPCAMERINILGPDGRSVFMEMTRRYDSGPALPNPGAPTAAPTSSK